MTTLPSVYYGFFGPRSCNVAQFFSFPASCRRRSGLYGDLFLFNLFCFVQQRLFWAMSLFTRRLMSWQFFFLWARFQFAWSNWLDSSRSLSQFVAA